MTQPTELADESASAAQTSRGGTASRSQAVLLAGHGARLGLGLLVTALLGRYLSPDDFGFFTLVGTILFVAFVVFDVGSGTVVVREIALSPERERAVLGAVLAWRRWSGLAIGLAVLLWALLESDGERRAVLVGLAVSLPLLAPSALMSVFRVRQEQEAPEAIRFLDHILVLVGVVLFVRLDLPGTYVGLLLVLRALGDALAIGWLAQRRLGYRPHARLFRRDLIPLLSMSAVQAAAVLLQVAYTHVDVFLVLLLRGRAELGAYSAAFRPINALLALPPLLMLPLLPVFSTLVKSAHARGGALVPYARRTTTLLVGIGALAGVSGGALAPDLIRLLYGGHYASGSLSAVAALSWLSAGFGVVFSTAVFPTVLLSLGHERRLLRISLIGLLVNIAGNLLLVPRWGFVAAAMTTALTYLVVGAAAVLESVRRLGPRVLSPIHLLSLLPAAGVGVLLALLPGSPVFRVAAGVLLGAAGSILLLTLPSARRLRRELAMVARHPDAVPPPGEDEEAYA